MAVATRVHDEDMIDYTPGADVSAGDVVVQGELVGIANRDIPANTLGSLSVTGVFDLPKVGGPDRDIAAGADVYWDEANQVAMDDAASGANKKVGRAVRYAEMADVTVRVRLSQ